MTENNDVVFVGRTAMKAMEEARLAAMARTDKVVVGPMSWDDFAFAFWHHKSLKVVRHDG